MGHVSLVRDLQPELQVSKLLRAALGDVDAALEADLGELRLGVVVNVLHVQPRVLQPQLAEVHVQLASHEHLCHHMDVRRVDWDLGSE